MHSRVSNVTVVVPVYNVERYIHRCIDSLLSQTRRPLEIILVNDGSTDSSGVICDEYSDKYDYIKTIHKMNGGLSSARKAGWEIAEGDLICFVDSDDFVADSYVEKLSEPFVSENIDLSICSWANDRAGVITPARLPYKETVLKNIDIAARYILPIVGLDSYPGAINLPGFVWIRMYRTALLQDADFVSEREYFTEDVIMNILYGKRIEGHIAVVNNPLYYYCVNPGSLTLKYRERGFLLRKACYNYCRALSTSLDVDKCVCEKRLHSNLTSAVTYGVYNVGRIRNYRNFKSELTKIFNDEDVKELISSGNWPRKAIWHKIIYLTYRYRAYFLLYKLLKTRKTL